MDMPLQDRETLAVHPLKVKTDQTALEATQVTYLNLAR